MARRNRVCEELPAKRKGCEHRSLVWGHEMGLVFAIKAASEAPRGGGGAQVPRRELLLSDITM